ncbi:inhibitor of growth protein 5-like isoform X2 [Halichondria panicea]|uniref:inhibitor of growth protein 5-like isoform X2 n=1 Tax=Halichondria panicea TaxID=6063 RepID=UPI00312B769C
MASALYLENFLESIETLPQELQRNFTVLRTLDQKTEDIKSEIDQSSQKYRLEVEGLNETERGKELSAIQDMFKKAIENSDNKVQMAMQMYEMVDKHIRHLDSELSRFEHELQLKDPHHRRTSTGSVVDLQMQHKGRKRTGGSESSGGVRKKKALSVSVDDPEPGPPTTPLSAGAIGAILPSTNPTDVLDMPVDPNEPTYCLCHQVSFGEMIGCDNADCPIEWFHFQCVGLTAKPKGKWYCTRCTQDKDKFKKKY